MTATIEQKTKRSTNDIISESIDRQQSWRQNPRGFARGLLRQINVFTNEDKTKNKKHADKSAFDENGSVLRAYWFPILCALIVIAIAVFVICFKINTPVKVIAPTVPEPIIKTVEKTKQPNIIATKPMFDIVRIEKSGQIVIAGRGVKESNISVIMNNIVVATERTNKDGEFVYAPNSALKPGNYEIYLIDVDKNIKSEDSVFVYVSENYSDSVSLLMNENGSKILQSSQSANSDLIVSKIDYLNTGRIVVTGRALPRLRVSLTLNNKYLGFARVSDYKNYGMGADVGKLIPGQKYTLVVRLHDTNGTTIANKKHEFIMPDATGCEDTYYTVRRGDSLWVIARNFLRRGVLFSIIADCNDIANPNLIYPKQILHIPVQ